MNVILMTEEFWANSQLSIARYYGEINYNGHRYIIVDKLGRDVYECSKIAMKEGRDKAIEPGEPADLLRDDFQKNYREIGRDRFMKILKEYPVIENPKQMRDILNGGEK